MRALSSPEAVHTTITTAVQIEVEVGSTLNFPFCRATLFDFRRISPVQILQHSSTNSHFSTPTSPFNTSQQPQNSVREGLYRIILLLAIRFLPRVVFQVQKQRQVERFNSLWSFNGILVFSDTEVTFIKLNVKYTKD